MATRMRNIPAVVEWTDTLSTPRSFIHLAGPHDSSLQINLSFDEQEQTAIFKIKIQVLLGVKEDTAHQDVDYLYLWIHPKDVILLVQDPMHRLQDGVSTVLRGPTTCLRLVLSKPAYIVAPSGFRLPLREGLGPQMLDSLVLLATQTVLAIHMEQRLVPNQTKIQHLCQAFCNGSVKQHPRHNTLRDFYKGCDAMIINDLALYARSEVKSTALTSDGPNNARDRPNNARDGPSNARDGPNNARDGAIPPPYAKARSPPPSLFAQQPLNKRQRVAADISTTISPDINVDTIPDQVTRQVDKHVKEEMAKIWDKRPYEWEQVTRDVVQQEVEYALETSLPKEMEGLKEAVKEECLDDLKDDLEEGLVRIFLPRRS
ncbi:hypothetical protein F5883DRAFT_22209 [Diaporthe sp. PMI_573]|nr:hypothetical protein F5883DRAFT_22209 [Diaporthaceae sp. PMI_573]